jgi:D-alanyl-D-alanine carboxypeptidase
MSRATVLATVASLLLAPAAGATSLPPFPALSGVAVKAIVIERRPGADFYGRAVLGAIGPDDPRGIGGTAAMLTALLAIECAGSPTPPWCPRPTRLDAAVRVGAFRRTDSLPELLAEGEQLSLLDLVHLTLLESWVDAARAIAEHLVNCQGQGWSTSEASADACLRTFADTMMKDRAYPIGVSGRTTFRGPADAHATARDLAILADGALRHSAFAAIVATPRRQVRWLAPAGKTRIVTNGLRHLDYPGNPQRREGVNGVRGGHSPEAGWNLVTSATRFGRSIIAVVLGAQSRDAVYADTDKLIDFGFAVLRLR